MGLVWSIRETLIWKSGFTKFMDLLRRTVFVPVMESCVRRPDRPRTTTMKLLYNICMRPSEIRLITRILKKRGPCRFLVFGLGNDSTYWRKVNRGGRTVFIEDDPVWLQRVTGEDPIMEAYLVEYGTERHQWRELLDRPASLPVLLPSGILEDEWDVVLVDAPNGMRQSSPGRMKSIFIASVLRADDSDVFVHDCNRPVEMAYSERYLGNGAFLGQVGRLRHYSYGPDTGSSVNRQETLVVWIPAVTSLQSDC
ncbi:MAG: hypothetical protein AVO35_07855 [Candidatus Aegiribacteria sp. MLS_C]|nr:MAG: hypothetical protein AVO35_07855 [Candidatus Aegiribacteria sp. MLS_C]